MRTVDLAHRTLVRTVPLTRVRGLGRMWKQGRHVAVAKWGSKHVMTELHGFSARINFANSYPYAIRLHPNYNAPLVELVSTSAEVRGRPVTVIDVGAAIGDTALLLLRRCDNAIAVLECLEGEPMFAELLRENVRDPRSRIHEVVLSDRPGTVPGLVRSQGTARARGGELVPASTLDLELADVSPDVLKIDADGFDGIILAGAKDLLDRARPNVLFEWHPSLCKMVGSDPQRAFHVLRESGYDRWIFFTKYGQFSHFGDACVNELEQLCLTTCTLPDWHYDVVALHPSSKIDEVALADLRRWGSSGYG